MHAELNDLLSTQQDKKLILAKKKKREKKIELEPTKTAAVTAWYQNEKFNWTQRYSSYLLLLLNWIDFDTLWKMEIFRLFQHHLF